MHYILNLLIVSDTLVILFTDDRNLRNKAKITVDGCIVAKVIIHLL